MSDESQLELATTSQRHSESPDPDAVALAKSESFSGSVLELMQPNVEFEDITFVEKVGHGSYGVVHKALWRNRLVAVKEFGANAEQKSIETEVKQLSRVSHENIIALYGISSNETSRFLIMEYAEGGSLHNFLHGKVKPYYSTAHAMSWARQCAEGVAYLHAMKPKPLIHRDLKPLNLLLSNKGRHLKICDFGTVADQATCMTNNKGSAAWMAPEVFKTTTYTEKCDIFSWGIVLWEFLSRQRPFEEIDNHFAVMWKINKGVRPKMIEDCPEQIKNLMTSCWNTVPDLRPSMQDVVSVMNELMEKFPGYDEPLEYEFKNQQIIRTDKNIDTNDNYKIDFSTINSSSRTPTNVITQSNTHSSPTPTSIPEETELSLPPSDRDDFNLTLSDASAQRFQDIRNNMAEMAGVVIAPLSVNVNPNAWDLPYNNSNTEYTSQNDDNEHLTVTVDPDCAEIDGAAMLDAELKPETPLPQNSESQQIYNEHLRLAKEYLVIDTKLTYARVFKENLLKELDPKERQQKLDLLKKMSEKEELLDLYNNLKQQLDKVQAAQQAGQINGIPPSGVQNRNDSNSSSNDLSNDDGWVFVGNYQNT